MPKFSKEVAMLDKPLHFINFEVNKIIHLYTRYDEEHFFRNCLEKNKSVNNKLKNNRKMIQDLQTFFWLFIIFSFRYCK